MYLSKGRKGSCLKLSLQRNRNMPLQRNMRQATNITSTKSTKAKESVVCICFPPGLKQLGTQISSFREDPVRIILAMDVGLPNCKWLKALVPGRCNFYGMIKLRQLLYSYCRFSLLCLPDDYCYRTAQASYSEIKLSQSLIGKQFDKYPIKPNLFQR